MFFDQQDKQNVQIQSNQQEDHQFGIRVIKPKLISSLNYQQEYLIRRKQKRNKKRTVHYHQFQENITEVLIRNKKYTKKKTFKQNQDPNKFFKQVYDGNDKILGTWKNGFLQGQAQIFYQNGDYFKGYFEKGYKIKGKMVFKDQAQYQGYFSNELFHGKGVLRLKNKTINTNWVNGLAQQSCVVQYKNGDIYYGILKQFKRHGYGYIFFPNDTKFFGQFVQGQIKGFGEFYQKGKLKYKGIWLNGKLIQQKKLQEQVNLQEQQQINWQAFESIFDTSNKKNIAYAFIFCGTCQFNGAKQQDLIKKFEQSKKIIKAVQQRKLYISQKKNNDNENNSRFQQYNSEDQHIEIQSLSLNQHQ